MSKKNKHRKFHQVPSNQEVNEIVQDRRYTQDVAKGLISLHKTDVLIKEFVMSTMNSIYEEYSLSNDCKVTKIEIIAPHLIEGEFDGNYVAETIKGFMKDCPDVSIDAYDVDAYTEAFLVQFEIKNGLTNEVHYMRAGELMVDDAAPSVFMSHM